MRIVYMGTPEFAVPALQVLCEAGYEVAAVVTQPDKAKDRGKKIQFTPVKEAAIACGIPVLQPEQVKGNGEFLQQITELAPDLIVVAAYGKILPTDILNIPSKGCVNIHASLLPKYRGAAPIHRAIIEGQEETGVTLMYMAEGMDTGDMIAKARAPIGEKTVSMLYQELGALGAELLLSQLPAIEAGTADRMPQAEAEATYAPMIFKQECFVDFRENPEKLQRLIQGTNSWPGAHTLYRGESMKLWEAKALTEQTDYPEGTILRADNEGIAVAAGGGGVLLIQTMQLPGKRSVKVSEFLKGNKIEIYSVLG